MATFVADASYTSGTGTSSTSNVTIPVSAAANDVAIITAIHPTGLLTTPTGWTVLSGPDPTSSSNANSYALIRTLASGDAGTTVLMSWSATNRVVAHLAVYRDATASGVSVTKITKAGASTTDLVPSATAPAGGVFHAAITTRAGFATATVESLGSPYTVGTNGTVATNGSSAPAMNIAAGYQLPSSTATLGGETETANQSHLSVSYAVVLQPLVVTGSLGLSGTGSLTLAGAPALTGSLGLTGNGTLTLSAASGTHLSGSLGLSGSGSLTLAGAPVLTAQLGLTGSGSLNLSGSRPAMSFLFTGPNAQRLMPISPPLVALMNFGLAVLRISGEWTETDYPSAEQIDAADIYLEGGRLHVVDQTTADALVIAGYDVTPIVGN